MSPPFNHSAIAGPFLDLPCLLMRILSSPAGLRRESPGYGDIDLQRKCSDTLEGFSPRTSGKRSRRKELLPAGK